MHDIYRRLYLEFFKIKILLSIRRMISAAASCQDTFCSNFSRSCRLRGPFSTIFLNRFPVFPSVLLYKDTRGFLFLCRTKQKCCCRSIPRQPESVFYYQSCGCTQLLNQPGVSRLQQWEQTL